MTDSHVYCQQAADLLSGDRARQNGSKLINHINIAELWTAWLRRRGLVANESKLTAHDAAVMMVLLKLARTLTGEHNPDDYRDAAGYAAIAGHLADIAEEPAPAS
jgi:Fe-S cluster biosynthesis and repair protein YggX